MTLQASGAISLSDINVELGRSSGAVINLSVAAEGGYAAINQNSPSKPDGTAPHALSEWYGYDHNYTCPAADTETGNQDCIANEIHLEYHDGNCGTYWQNTMLLC